MDFSGVLRSAGVSGECCSGASALSGVAEDDASSGSGVTSARACTSDGLGSLVLVFSWLEREALRNHLKAIGLCNYGRRSDEKKIDSRTKTTLSITRRCRPRERQRLSVSQFSQLD